MVKPISVVFSPLQSQEYLRKGLHSYLVYVPLEISAKNEIQIISTAITF